MEDLSLFKPPSEKFKVNAKLSVEGSLSLYDNVTARIASSIAFTPEKNNINQSVLCTTRLD